MLNQRRTLCEQCLFILHEGHEVCPKAENVQKGQKGVAALPLVTPFFISQAKRGLQAPRDSGSLLLTQALIRLGTVIAERKAKTKAWLRGNLLPG